MMSPKISPCKDCVGRYTACHDHCEKYAKWKEVLHKEQALEKEYKKRRHEDFLRSEECEAGRQRFAASKNRMRRGQTFND